MRLNFQAKVLLPVMGIMIVLIVGFMWFVNQRMSGQLQAGASESLTTADAVFRNLQSLHARNLLVCYRNAANDPRFRAVLQRFDSKTVGVLLRELLEENGGDVVVFGRNSAEPLAEYSRNANFNLAEFALQSKRAVDQALREQDQPSQTTISVGGRLFDIISIPVSVGQEVLGALTFGIEIGDDVIREFKAITRSEILLLVDEQIAASTLSVADLPSELHQSLLKFVHNAVTQESSRRHPDTVLINNEHFMYAARELGEPQSGARLRYVLLSSYEKPLKNLHAMHQNFLSIQLVGILVGGALVWLLVRRVTSPLRQLRDIAEAVGRGDFTRRVEIQSGDEFGELGAVFNQMTSNLKTSRQELEKTVDSLTSTQAQLIQSEKLRAIGTLAGGIAHDFNNILGAILGFGELAIEDVPPEGRTARNLKQVLKAGHRAKDLVRQILAFSRQNDPERGTVRLNNIVDETLKLLRATIPSTVEIRGEIRTDHDTVVADPTQLHQVLMNLGTNASHAMRESGGTLLVALDEYIIPNEGASDSPNLPDGPYVRLCVSDTGHGMPPDILERIFEPFFTTKPVGEGTGLGLSVVHGIIKGHGGEITVRSEPGVGTTFFIFLPRATADEAPATPSDEPVSGNLERILVVDDEEPLANLMQQRLSRLGYEVVAHCNSFEAFREFEAAPEQFDLIITDQTMPHLTGDDLARRVSEVRPGTPIILCSGSGHALLNAEAKSHAMHEYVAKPINFAELSRRIRHVLEAKSEGTCGLNPTSNSKQCYETNPGH